MREILMIIILVFLFMGNATANPNDCDLHQINTTHWYFVTTQTDFVYGTYNYQAFANNISSDYRELEYGVMSSPTNIQIYQKLLLLESQNDEMLLNMSINNTIVNDKIDTILIFILLNMAVIVGIIIGKRGKDNDK